MWRGVLVAVLAAGLVSGEDLVVVTPRGEVRGSDEGNYSTYFGIPYARVREENPFGESTPYPIFTEPFEANDPTIKCPQALFGPEGTLQCLTLNIFVPRNEGQGPLPVLMYFYGGGFFWGSAGDFDGKYLVEQDIIIVIANYRLGPYGFFCLNTPQVPGNQGLKDQVAAMKWVQDNIQAFGGDPEKVTISGESAGAISVDLHMYSNFEKYFDKVIMQSGSAETANFFSKPDYAAAVKLANLLNYTAVTTSDALKFLTTVDPIKLMTAFNSSDLMLGPCKEKKFRNVQSFLTNDVFYLCKPERVRDTPVLIGYNSKEKFQDVVMDPASYFGSNQDIFMDQLNEKLDFNMKELKRLVEIVKNFYLGSKPVTIENFLPVTDFLSDFIFNYATENAVTRLVDQGAIVYKYLFSYIGNSRYSNITGVGAFHGQELQYLYEYTSPISADINNVVTTPDDVLVRDRMTTMWANFVKYGNPTPETTSLLPVLWPVVPRDSRPYLNIDLELSVGQDVYQERIAFMNLFWAAFWRSSKIIN